MPKKITQILIEGYTSIRSATVAIGDVTVLVGANGAGKSNFIAALELLGRIADQGLAFEVGLRGGASALLNAAGNGARHIRLRIEADSDLAGRTDTYEATLIPAANEELVFARETASHFEAPGSPRLIQQDFGGGHRESKLGEAVEGGLPALDILRGCRVFHFQDTSRAAPVKRFAWASDNQALHPDAENLAPLLLRLRENSPSHYKRILAAVKMNAPFFRDFVLADEGNGKVRLRWTQVDVDTVFPAEALSDGTLRYICLATLLLQPDPPALIALDEPELGLHPFAIRQLADLIKSASTHTQIVIATQSVTLLNQFDLDDLVVVNRIEGNSEFGRPDKDRLREQKKSSSSRSWPPKHLQESGCSRPC